MRCKMLVKSELNKLFNLAKKSYEFVFPEKPDNSLEVKLNIKLDSMGDWYDRLEKSKKCIYELYYYYSDQLISEYESTGLS